MIVLSEEKVKKLHQMMVKSTGGSDAIRDTGLLESALANAFAGFGDIEFYPTVDEKAARLCYELINNHAFVDGNKRIGIFVMLVFLRVNGVSLSADNNEIIDLGLGVASGKYDYEYILEWIKSRR